MCQKTIYKREINAKSFQNPYYTMCLFLNILRYATFHDSLDSFYFLVRTFFFRAV